MKNISFIDFENTDMLNLRLSDIENYYERRVISIETIKRFLRKQIYRVWIEYTVEGK